LTANGHEDAGLGLSTCWLKVTLFPLAPQAHMQARFVILRVLLEAGEGLVTVTPTTGSDGRPDARVRLDRSKIRSVGRPALEQFLRKLQVSEGFLLQISPASAQSPTLIASWSVPLSIQKVFIASVPMCQKLRLCCKQFVM
jgi:hypothetical protein